MDAIRELYDNLQRVQGRRQVWVYQGIVSAVNGILCDVQVGDLLVPDVRLRASEGAKDKTQTLITPKVGSAVIIGSLTGEFDKMAVLAVDEVESIDVNAKQVTINGGENGGLIKIDALIKELNAIEDDINALKSVFSGWIVSPQDGGLALYTAAQSWAGQKLKVSERKNYEDTKITH